MTITIFPNRVQVVNPARSGIAQASAKPAAEALAGSASEISAVKAVFSDLPVRFKPNEIEGLLAGTAQNKQLNDLLDSDVKRVAKAKNIPEIYFHLVILEADEGQFDSAKITTKEYAEHFKKAKAELNKLDGNIYAGAAQEHQVLAAAIMASVPAGVSTSAARKTADAIGKELIENLAVKPATESFSLKTYRADFKVGEVTTTAVTRELNKIKFKKERRDELPSGRTCSVYRKTGLKVTVIAKDKHVMTIGINQGTAGGTSISSGAGDKFVVVAARAKTERQRVSVRVSKEVKGKLGVFYSFYKKPLNYLFALLELVRKSADEKQVINSIMKKLRSAERKFLKENELSDSLIDVLLKQRGLEAPKVA